MKLSQPIPKAKAAIAVSSLHLSKPDILALVIILLSSTQLGLHFWPTSAFVYGLRVDYLSPTLYFLDVLIAIYLAIKYKFVISSTISNRQLTIASLILPLLLTNLLFSVNPIATLSWSLHLLLFLTFVYSLSQAIVNRQLAIPLSLMMLFQVFLGGYQVALGRTIQGPLYWLGERALNVGSPNVAKADIFGELTLRAYGTFSHPNALAGWLILSLLIVIHLSRKSKSAFSHWQLTISAMLCAIGVLITQSRSAAISLFGIVIPFYLLQSLRVRLIYFVILLSTVYCLLFTVHSPKSTNFPTRSDLSVSERLILQNVSFSTIKSYPLFGTGANASISTYPALAPNQRLLQPDHNSFTLLFSWFGLAGLLSLILMFRYLSAIDHLSSAIFPSYYLSSPFFS